MTQDTVRELIASSVAAVVGMALLGEVDGAVTRQRIYDAQSNHARAEGTWTPHEAGLNKARREYEHLVEAERNHAHAEGTELQPSVLLGESA